MTLGAVLTSAASWSYYNEYIVLAGPSDSNLKSKMKLIVWMMLESP